MCNDTLGAEELAELKTVTNDLSRTYHSLVRDVGIAVADVEYVIDPANYYEQAFIKELCVCVHGEDIRERFGPYKLTPERAIRFNGDIHEVLERTKIRIEAANRDEVTISI